MSFMLQGMSDFLWGIVKIPLFILFLGFVLFCFLAGLQVLVLRFKGVRRIKKVLKSTYKKRSIFMRLFVDLPKRLAEDFMYANPNDFPYKGMIIFTGRQGNGKTIALVNEVIKMQKQFPQSKVITNLAYAKEDTELKHWRQLTDYTNGPFGVICAIDETQNWFSSSQSKNFPPEMLEVITQNRKNRRIILGTAQNFYLLSKAIRTQCTEIRSCFTLFGCLTIVKRCEPVLDFEGGVAELKRKGYYFFVHSRELRESYDTYRVIESLSNSGFVDVQSMRV